MALRPSLSRLRWRAHYTPTGPRVKTPHELDVFADVVLGYRPQTQQKKSGKRKKRAAKKAAKMAKAQADAN